MKKLLASLPFATCLAPIPVSGASGLVDQPLPLKLKIVSRDGKAKLKAARKLPVLISCSKLCDAKVKMTIFTPVGKGSVADAGQLGENKVLTIKFGFRYLKDNYRKSKLKVKFSAKDVETGKRVAKTRAFRFYR